MSTHPWRRGRNVIAVAITSCLLTASCASPSSSELETAATVASPTAAAAATTAATTTAPSAITHVVDQESVARDEDAAARRDAAPSESLDDDAGAAADTDEAAEDAAVTETVGSTVDQNAVGADDEFGRETAEEAASDAAIPDLTAIATPGWMEANGAVAVDDTGLVWVPWPAFDAAADSQLVAERELWDATMPPYLDWVARAIAAGEPIAREKAGKAGSWHPVVDKTDLDVHYTERGANVSEEITVCPRRLGENNQQSRQRMNEMLAPGGLRIHAVATVGNPISWLLSFSPGEPMSVAGQRFLADQGFVPGDWSAEALEVTVRRAALAAVIEELVPRAAMSAAPESLWEACMDVASTAAHSNRRSGSWGITLQALWNRGLRLEYEARPIERAWVEAVESGSRAGVIVCRSAETVHLVDFSTGRRVGVLERRAEAARALHLTWTGDRYRAYRWESIDGRCEPGSAAWSGAVAQLGEWADEAAARVDLARRWALGMRQTWMRVGQWVDVPQEVAWEAHRSAGLDLRMWCAIGPPIRDPFTADELRDLLRLHCTPEQRARMLDQVAASPAYTPVMTGFVIGAGQSWADRADNRLRTTEQILGCAPTEAEIAEDQRTRPIEPTMKRPWPPGLLPGGPKIGWPILTVPCPGIEWPPFDDERYWWPAERAPAGNAGQRHGPG